MAEAHGDPSKAETSSRLDSGCIFLAQKSCVDTLYPGHLFGLASPPLGRIFKLRLNFS